MTAASSSATLLAALVVVFFSPSALLLGCSPARTARRPESAAPAVRRLTVDGFLSQPADVEVTLHPPVIVRDRVYGPFLRRASALAAAYAGPRTLGATALTALERTEEVDVAMDDAGEAVVLLRGVPADLDVTEVVDEKGQPVWKAVVGDVRQSLVEYEPANGSPASLFVVPQRTWIVAAGTARARTRATLVEASGGVTFEAGAIPPEGPGLARLSIRGGALVRREERLRTGSLAPLGTSLVRASFELMPGPEGVILARLEYASGSAAAAAQQTAQDVVGAFRRKLEEMARPAAAPSLSWLAAAGVERDDATVRVRAPIPKAWLDAIAQADVSGAHAGDKEVPSDVPWALWRRSSPAPTLALPR